MKQVITDPDFTATLEWEDGRVWVHNEVSRYSKDVLRRLRIALESLYDIAGTDTLWCLKDVCRMPYSEAVTFHKYVTMMGFKDPQPEQAGDGTVCWAYKKERNPSIGKE